MAGLERVCVGVLSPDVGVYAGAPRLVSHDAPQEAHRGQVAVRSFGPRAFSIADPLARQLLRLVLGTAVRLADERLTTIAIPEDLKKFADVEKDVVLVGQGDYIEIWAPQLWSTQETRLRDAESNSSRFAALQIATR